MDKWNELIQWGEDNHLLATSEINIINKIKNTSITGKLPTAREQKKIVVIIKKLEDEGMSSIL